MDPFPAMRWSAFERLLMRAPLSYKITRQTGSHRTMVAENRPTLHLSFHDNQELAGRVVKKILVTDIGLPEADARKLV